MPLTLKNLVLAGLGRFAAIYKPMIYSDLFPNSAFPIHLFFRSARYSVTKCVIFTHPPASDLCLRRRESAFGAEAPSTKIQTPEKLQYPSSQSRWSHGRPFEV